MAVAGGNMKKRSVEVKKMAIIDMMIMGWGSDDQIICALCHSLLFLCKFSVGWFPRNYVHDNGKTPAGETVWLQADGKKIEHKADI